MIPDLQHGYTTGLLLSFFMVLGLVLILDLVFSSASILNVLSLSNGVELGHTEGRALTSWQRQHEDMLTSKVYGGLISPRYQ